MYDWNHSLASSRAFRPAVVDESLRDGLQSPSVCDPPLAQKVELVHLMAGLGIDCAALGYPAARERQYEDVLELARELSRSRLPLHACCAARALERDIVPILEICERTGIEIEVGIFVASSPLRRRTEGWSIEYLLRLTDSAVSFAVRHGLRVLYVAEDSTRSPPDMLEALYGAAVAAGARRVCLADTTGHATPEGATALVRFVRQALGSAGADVGIDWHGHRDRGLALAASLAAFQAGAERCHGTALGVGERAGNTPIELLLVNLLLEGYRDTDLRLLPAYAEAAARAFGLVIPPQQPVVGRDAFRTGTGTHAAALVKGREMPVARQAIDSSIPPALVGRRSVIEIGPLSGSWNVIGWLRERGLPSDDALVSGLLRMAKSSDRVLSEAEVLEHVRQVQLGEGRRSETTESDSAE